MSKTYCIYTHTSPSEKVYVGQSVNVKKRWGYNGEHYKNKKNDGSYIQPLFARAIDKYGWNNFEHNLVLEGISKSEADYSERYLIRWYKIQNMSYNITNGGEGCDAPRPPLTEEQRRKISERLLKNHPMRGKHWSPEILAKITAANRNRVYTPEQREAISKKSKAINLGRKASEESKKKLSEYKKSHPETWIGGWNKIEVHQYGCDGKYIASFPSASEAAELLGVNISSDILNCIKGKTASAGGYFWRKEKAEFIDVSSYKIIKTKEGMRVFDISEDGRLKRSAAHGRPVKQYALDGKYINTFCSASEAARKTGVNYSGINRCCEHKCRYKTAGGFKWEFDNNEQD